MGEEIQYDANLVIQKLELGLEYLLQVDTKEGRMFISLNTLVLSLHDNSFPNKPGEYFVGSNKAEDTD